MDINLLKKYAKLAVTTGVNIQKDNILVISSPIETAEFARLITEEAYKAGAKDVIVHYGDQKLTKIKLENSSLETIADYPSWMAESYNYYARQGACFISIAVPSLTKCPNQHVPLYSPTHSTHTRGTGACPLDTFE